MSFEDKIQKNVLLAESTSFKIGGPAKYFFIGANERDILKAVAWAKQKKEKIFILGGGSKLLFDDKGFDGLIIKMENNNKPLAHPMKSGNGKYMFKANAGCRLSIISSYCYKHSLTGMEWCIGIPGISLGGAIFGNAGAFGASMGDFVKKVKVLRISDSAILEMRNSQCQFTYRGSMFKEFPADYLIMGAELEMLSEEKEVIKKKMENNFKFRLEKQVFNYPNVGSIFKNIALHKMQSAAKDLPEQFKNSGVIPAGWLIEHSNLKGIRVGDALISERHANLIINEGNAKSSEVKELINFAKKKVKERFGVELEEEIIIVD